MAATRPALNVATSIADGDVRFPRSEIDIGKRDGDAGEEEQGRTHHQVSADMMLRRRARNARARQHPALLRADYS